MVVLEVTKGAASALLAAVAGGPGFLQRRVRVPMVLNHRRARVPVSLGLGLALTIELAVLAMVAGDAIGGRPLRASDLWLAGGFARLREEWRRLASTLGQRVRTPEGREGLAVDVDDDGALLVDAGEGTLTRLVAGTRVLAP